MTDDYQLRVSKIRNGTVIDHVAAGRVLNVLAILGIDGISGEAVSIGMNVPSDRFGRKDIMKVEGRELSQSEVDMLLLIAPAASINIVRDYDMVERNRIVRPDAVASIISCPNRNCIPNADEPIQSHFTVFSDGVRCDYCETIVREDEVAANLDVNWPR